jgi:hypothetical protein
MKKILLTLVFALAIFNLAISQIVYEDFEDTPLTWNPFGDGVFNGVIDNPIPDAINGSTKVGSYTKSAAHAFSLLIAFTDIMDLSVNNQFSIDVYTPVATQVLFKLEGTGEAIESTKNISNADLWQTLTFDLSAAAGFTTIEKIIIFFDPGVEMSEDTYLFDNIRANPAGPCAGTIPDPNIIDNYECQRNASYGAGWDILQVIPNPAATGINPSASVGQYEDPAGPWSAMVIDYNNVIDFSVKNQVKVKIWSSKAVPVLFKLEGGASPAYETWMDITQTNTWVEYTADFSSQSGADHKKIVIFFNGGNEPDPGDTYYVDDLIFGEAPPASALEDFENGATLGWIPLNSDMTNHGTFNGAITNPDLSGVNITPNIGSYTKGEAAFSTLTAFLPTGIDLSVDPQLNIQVWAPAGSAKVIMQLVSPTQGAKDVERDITATMEWVSIGFNFEEFAAITDFESINLLFDGGTAALGTTYFFDNLAQTVSTVDPCENVMPIANIVDDFECQRNVTYGCGIERLTQIDNPDITPENGSAKVGEYKDPTDEWSALCFESGGSWDLTTRNQLKLKIWSPLAVPILFKLEGGTATAVEVFVEVTETNQWIDYVVDFSANAGEDHARLVVFFNAGQLPTAEDLYYFDDVRWTRSIFTGCIDDHEDATSTIENFSYFANGHLEAEGKIFAVVDNPNADAVNPSEKVGEFVKADDALPFAGMFASLEAPIDFLGNKTAKAQVLMDHIGNFAIKLEGSQTGAAPLELIVPNTVINAWEELTFDFSAVPDDAEFARITIFFDLSIDATGFDVTSYFDNIVIGDATCLSTGIFNPVTVEQFKISPNPTSNFLLIENMQAVKTIAVLNLWGQTVQTANLLGEENLELEVSHLTSGTYLVTGYDKNGNLIANAKFVKE